MVGHYVFNASAIGLGGVLTTPKRKVIPSLAPVSQDARPYIPMPGSTRPEGWRFPTRR